MYIHMSFSSFNSYHSKVPQHLTLKLNLKYSVTFSGIHTILFIKQNCTLSFSSVSDVCYFLICSGGGGGGVNGVGGTGGGVNLGQLNVTKDNMYPITIGTGGVGGIEPPGLAGDNAYSYSLFKGSDGGSSSAFGVTVNGAGAGTTDKYQDGPTVLGGTRINNNAMSPSHPNGFSSGGRFPHGANTYSNGPALISSKTGVNGLYQFGGGGANLGYYNSYQYGGGTNDNMDGIPNSGGGGTEGSFERNVLSAGKGGSGIVVVSFLTNGNSYTIV